MQGTSYTTRGGIRIQRETWIGPYEREHDTLAHTLDDRRGVLLSSSFEFPGRYTRLDMGFVDPPLVLAAEESGSLVPSNAADAAYTRRAE